MGIFKDWRDDSEGYVFRYKVGQLFSPRVWFRLHKWRKQRADRGWSDRDTWGAGDHIAKMTAEMLQHLNDHAYVDWPEWFKLNVQEKDGYKNLQSIIDDINNYLEFTSTTSWADGLELASYDPDELFTKREDGNYGLTDNRWVDTNGTPATEKHITMRIKKWHKEDVKLYKKATDAMQFFGRHFTGFWD